MADTTAASAFVRDWIATEHQVEEALWTERDDGALQGRIEDLDVGYYAGSLDPLITRGPTDDAYFARAPGMLAILVPRTLFRVERYRHPELGELYAAYVSNTRRRTARQLFSRYFVQPRKEGTLRLVARYNLCNECQGSGTAGGGRCPECGGKAWVWLGGAEIPDPGEREERIEFEEPENGWPAEPGAA